MTARLCEANASFSSTRSRSPGRFRPARRGASAPPEPGRCPSPADRHLRRRSRRTRPAARRRASAARSSLAITSAAAPSLIPLELPAVTRSVLLERRLQRRELLGVVSARGCSSRSSSPTGTSSSAKRPAASAAAPAPLRLERERVLVLARHRPSARRRSRRSRPSTRAGTAPPSAGSGSASRASCPRRSGCRAETPSPACAITSGARLIDSTPPATNRSPSPAITAWQAPTTADRPEAHSRLTVTPATDSGRPASSARHPRDVAVVLAGLVGAAEPDVLDLAGGRRPRARPRPRSPSPRGRPAAPPRARRRSGRPGCARRRG